MMKASVVTDLQQEEAGTRAMRVGKKIIKISFATISTELPVSLGEKRNANEILICCLGFYGAAFVPRYCSSSPVKGTRCEGRRKRGGEDGPGQRALGLRTATGASGGHSGESLPPWPPGLGFPSWRNPTGQSLSLPVSYPFSPRLTDNQRQSHHETTGRGS